MFKDCFFKSLVLSNIIFFLIFGGYYLKGSEIECKSADFVLDYKVDFADLADFANNWLNDVNGLNWNERYDLDCSQAVDLNDLEIFCEHWLETYPDPNDTFGAFKNALAAGNVQVAVSFFADSVSDDYAVILTELQTVLPEMANGMGQLQLIYSDDNIAQYEMLHDEGGGVISSFPVYFAKDPNGNWKIYCF